MLQQLTIDELRLLSFKFGQTFQQEQQDLDVYVLAAKVIIEAALALSETAGEESTQYASVALATSYNLSAVCWPAWDADCYGVPEDKLDLGLEAAEFNVALADKLDLGPEKKKNAAWIKGAHLAVRERFAEAKSAFEACEEYSKSAADKDAELMARGWVLLMNQLLGEDGAEA